MTRWLCSVLLLPLLAACDEGPRSVTVRNECYPLVEGACGRERGLRCDSALSACVRDKAQESYQLVVRVSASTEGTILTDAGVQLVPSAVRDLGMLSGQRDAEVVRVPDAVPASGYVPLLSELTITARDSYLPLPTSVVETRSLSPSRDAGAQALPALLHPGYTYDVHVQPLLQSSSSLPPMDVRGVRPEMPIDVSYSAVERRAGKFGMRGTEAQRARRVRLQDKRSGRVVSSSNPVNDDGTFEVFAPPEVFLSGNFNLVVGLADFDPWQVTMTIDGTRFLTGSEIILPAVPAQVTVSNSVEDEDGRKLLGAELLFVSRYPLPKPEDGGTQPSVGGTDWCRWEDPYPITCNGRFRTVSTELGTYTIDLVPGVYDVFIWPNTRDLNSRGVRVSKNKEEFIVTEGAGEGLAVLVAERTAPYRGTILSTVEKLASPNITVRALARPTPPFSSWGELANYNRSYASLTDGKGHFELFPDIGYYDFVVEPPESSGFAWKLWLDCPSGPAGGSALAEMNLAPPVMVYGVVEHERTRVKLPNAQIEAYAVVRRREDDPRSVLIGRTVSDENGAFRLALPPRVGEDSDACEGSAVTDSEP